MTTTNACPCGRPMPYPECCGLFHRGAQAPTAELLMRSRYTAFVMTDEAYLLRTWHPDTRPGRVRFDPAQSWLGLHILAATGGGLFDQVGTVDFRADYRLAGRTGAVRENSRFVRHGPTVNHGRTANHGATTNHSGEWVYVGLASDES